MRFAKLELKDRVYSLDTSSGLHVAVPEVEGGPSQQLFSISKIILNALIEAGNEIASIFIFNANSVVISQNLLDVLDGANLGQLVGNHELYRGWLIEQWYTKML